MKRLLFLLTVIVFPLSAQDNVFSYTVSENIVTQNTENTRAVHLDRNLLDQIISENSNDFFLKLPLINENFLDVYMRKFSVLSPDHKLIIEKSTGQDSEEYSPDFRSYYILYEGNSIGTFLCFENSIVISYKHNNRQFEINKIDNEFLLFDVNDCLMSNTFSCEVEEKIERMNIEENYPESSFMTPKCLELAVEVDQYTRNTFSSNTTTTNWAHAILAGVSQVYDSEVNLNISIVTTIIWETTDPYASYINDASNMLAALRNHWTSNNGSISRDLVHLMTKRSNTGTGGIAYRDVLCSNSWGYAFSSDLNNTTNFNFPNPSYTWNLMVCSHEIGHNIESHHTHWCGWPGGPIDNCADVEGNCTNNPAPQVGTIMSYCHTTSSGSLIDFHSIVVNNALTPGINGASCLTTCTFYGCTDPNATNYDPNATVDDGSCTYSPPALIAISTNISCNGLSDGSIDLSVSGGLSPYTYVWSNGSFSQDISNLLAGTYTISVTDALGQTATSSYNITEPSVITPIYTVTNTTGFGMSNGSISVSVSGGTPPYTYYWIGYTSTSAILSNLISGTYVSYIIDANNCYVVDSIDVFDDVPTPIHLTYFITDVLCTGNSTGSIDITVSGGVPPYSYLWSNGSTSEDLSNITAGNYIINITDDQGQSRLDTMVVNEPLPLSLSYVITNESSVGASDGSIDLTVTGGTPPFSYFWNTNPSQTTEDITNLSAGTYVVYVGYNNWTCFITDTVVVSLGLSGCTDPIACNYNPSAITDDGSCFYQSNPVTDMSLYTWEFDVQWGCSGTIYSAEMEFDSSGTGVVNPGTSGATNINWSLCDSVLSWVYSGGTLYTLTDYNNGIFTGTMISGSSTGCFTLTPIIPGCLDSTSPLYNPLANYDDGSCCDNYMELSMYSSWSGGGWNSGTWWTISDLSGAVVYTTQYVYNSGTDTYNSPQYFCLPVGCYTITCNGTNGGLGSVSWSLLNTNTSTTVANGGAPYINQISVGGVVCPIFGCTDSLADNYDSTANSDDGSCIYSGCTDSTALNYNPNVNLDDGSCVYCSCGQITGVNTLDIIHDRATFNWDNMNSSCCDVDQIRFRYREAGTNAWSTKTMGSPTGTGCNTLNTSKLILGLFPSTTYEYEFKIWYCNASTVNWHASGTFTTLSSCPNVTNFTSTPITNTKVKFDWNLNGTYSFLRIKLREDSTGSPWMNAGGFGVNYPAITKNKNGLLPGQTYRAQARTWCDPNGGAYRSTSWTPLVFWTQPTNVRLLNTNEISLLKVIDILGREVNPDKVINSTTLFYIYSDGGVERRIVFE